MSFQYEAPARPERKPKSGLPGWAWALIICAVGIPVGLMGLSIVAAVAIPNLMAARIEANRKAAERDVLEIAEAVEAYAAIHGGCPPNLALLVRPDENGVKYLNRPEAPVDPWGRPYLLADAGELAPYPVVYTLGQDGCPGGEFFDADISVGVGE
ncbi:MAG: type II secretion system protein GspG [Planctomycetota bacterium]